MNIEKIQNLVNRSTAATLSYIDEEGFINSRRVFCTFHSGLYSHMISTNTSSEHVQSLLKNSKACLYFHDDEKFEGVSFSGNANVHFEQEYKTLLWHDEDIKYYKEGVNDPDYCVIEFQAEKGRFYDGKAKLYKGNISKEEIISTYEKK